MGLVYANIELLSGEDLLAVRRGRLDESRVKRTTVTAMVDSGATMLAIPAFIKTQLDLLPMGELEADLADGSVSTYEIVGPIEVRYLNRRASVEALVLPQQTQVLLGAIPMEAMDALVDPKRQQLIVNP
ncbi:MAG: aspartyl protease family protein, partial [Cyanobacteria bacterium P01_H01_bin.121]